MIEGTPGVPYGALMSCFNMVECNMIRRRTQVESLLKPNEVLLSISFPALGTSGFTDPEILPNPNDPNTLGGSIFYPDEAIYQGHPR